MVFPCVCLFLREGLPAAVWLCPEQSSSQEGSRLPCPCGASCSMAGGAGTVLPTWAQQTGHRGALQPSSTLCCTFVTMLVVCIYSGVRDGTENIPGGKVSQCFLF